jgi:hypothetical protein
MGVREVKWEPDEFARVVSHPLVFHARDCIRCFFFGPCSEVDLGTASYEVESNVQANTRA